MSYVTVAPSASTSTRASSAAANAGTLRRVTRSARPSDTATVTSTSPAGVSSRMRVSGSLTSTIPVSTSTVATPIVPWPHIGSRPDTSTNSTPQSASGRVGGCRNAPDIAEWPRGSRINRSRRSSRCSSKYSRRSCIVAPGTGPSPPVITRVGIPSVCESTAAK